jgi:hypothetical protein
MTCEKSRKNIGRHRNSMSGGWREEGRLREKYREKKGSFENVGEISFGDSSEFPIPQFRLVSLCVCVCVWVWVWVWVCVRLEQERGGRS